jgi:hypothetical protein
MWIISQYMWIFIEKKPNINGINASNCTKFIKIKIFTEYNKNKINMLYLFIDFLSFK